MGADGCIAAWGSTCEDAIECGAGGGGDSNASQERVLEAISHGDWRSVWTEVTLHAELYRIVTERGLLLFLGDNCETLPVIATKALPRSMLRQVRHAGIGEWKSDTERGGTARRAEGDHEALVRADRWDAGK